MYHCSIHFYLLGQPNQVFEIIKGMPPLEHFNQEFSESKRFEKGLAAEADVILADVSDRNVREAVEMLIAGCRDGSRLILLAEKEQIAALGELLTKIEDIWTLPLSEEEVEFRFLRWQQAYKAEQDAWQTSQYLEATINHVPNLIWYKDKNGIHKKVNDSFCRTVNKSRQQIEGRGHAYIWDVEEDDPACIESEQEVMRKRETCISEEIIKTGEGTRTLTTYKSPLYDVNGSVMGTVGVAIDVTQERAYEREIIEKNQKLETIFTTIDCGVIRHTLDGSRVLSINLAALKILGYDSKEELIENGFSMVANSVVEEDQEKLKECMKALKQEGDSVSVEYRVRHKDGDILHVMGNVKLLEENGELIYQRFLLDCTEQKRQERRNERRQMELIQALTMEYSLVCSFDLATGKGRTLRSSEHNSQELATIFSGEISLEDSMRRYIERYVYEEDRELMQEASSLDRLQRALENQREYHVNYRMTQDDKVVYYQMRAVRAGARNENYVIVLGLRSVDEETRKEMEHRSLLESALHQANRANKAKSTFLSNMSHDIRTPMNAIVGFTNLALSHIAYKEQVEEYLKKIMTSGNHLLSLINDVLDMSHIESGKIHLEEQPCSLPDILHGLHNILQGDIHSKQLELQIDTIDVLDEEIYCDKLRLNQVLLNLLSNAVKYTGAGGIVSMRITERKGITEGYASYEFLIKDTGIGMSEEFVAHIFEPFEREQNATLSGVEGTGLGMAITKNIVDMMNGSIEIHSEQGVGTEITVSFPFRLCAESREHYEIEELKGCRALVVDDDYNTCDSVSYMLAQLGLRAEWTLSGKEAVLRTHQAITRDDDYGVYIIDWLLPDINGVEVARRIRQKTGDTVPIVVLTAYDWSDIEEEAREAGVTAFCSKPLFLSELKSCLQSIIQPEREEELSVTKESALLRSGRILLVEDLELNQEIAVAILGDAGFSTDVAGNGQIAIEMLEKSEPGYYQVVLMDVQMPVMNGYEATKAIRKLTNQKLASIPIIAMTANAFEEDKKEALRCGMNGHIAKPIDIGKLFETLELVMEAS